MRFYLIWVLVYSDLKMIEEKNFYNKFNKKHTSLVEKLILINKNNLQLGKIHEYRINCLKLQILAFHKRIIRKLLLSENPLRFSSALKKVHIENGK